MTKHISMNGATFNPSSIKSSERIVGVTLAAASGTENVVYRNRKLTWTIGWADAVKAVRDAVRTISRLTTTFTFVDEDGTSYTAQCTTNYTFDADTTADRYAPGTDTLLYNFSITVRQI